MDLRYRYIFYDLDGAITQSEFGILNSIEYALKEMGVGEHGRKIMIRLLIEE